MHVSLVNITFAERQVLQVLHGVAAGIGDETAAAQMIGVVEIEEAFVFHHLRI